MQLTRCFIAIDYPADVLTRVGAIIRNFSQVFPRGSIRWVPAGNLHLTLKFLGEVTSDQILEIREILTEIAQRTAPFPLKVSGSGVFPNPYQPKTLWIGTSPTQPLLSLAKEIDRQVSGVGILMETRPFSPHLTIGRVQSGLPPSTTGLIGSTYSRSVMGDLGEFSAENITLYKSELRSTGAVYSVVERYPLHAGKPAK